MVLLKSDEQMNKGDPAPDFSLINVDNSIVTKEMFNGKPFALIFICNHCPYVIPKMDEIAQLQKDYEGKVAIICISSNDPTDYPDDSFENMQKLAQEKGYKYYLFDETQEIAKAYGAVCTPDPFLFDQDHKLAYHGRFNDAMSPDATPSKHNLREAIDKMLAGQEIVDWFVPSMGCSIKWKA
ncbi:thioredoxin family protein [Candidatus Woesearchaeota archaeon]|nr:thioredoxin family protein [Candidatus Woesearchaeota archaeon]